MIAAWALRYLPHLVAVAVVIAAVLAFSHWRYTAGQNERTAFYQPILQKIDTERLIAERDNNAKEQALATRITSLEQTHAENEKSLRARADAAERGYARSMQELARRRIESASSTPAHPGEPGSTSGIAQCVGEYAAAARRISERAVRDAQRLARCQELLRAERNILNP